MMKSWSDSDLRTGEARLRGRSIERAGPRRRQPRRGFLVSPQLYSLHAYLFLSSGVRFCRLKEYTARQNLRPHSATRSEVGVVCSGRGFCRMGEDAAERWSLVRGLPLMM